MSRLTFKRLIYNDWVDINPGNKVLVKRQGENALHGSVDDVAEDGSFFWVWMDEGRGRVLISEDDGSTVWTLVPDPGDL